MKRKLSLLLAMVLAMTMVVGIGVTAFAVEGLPENTPNAVSDYIKEQYPSRQYFYVTNNETYTFEGGGPYDAVQGREFEYSLDGSYTGSKDYYDGSSAGKAIYCFENTSASIGWYYNKDMDGVLVRCPSQGPNPKTDEPSNSVHIHSFQWQTIYEATPNSDGLEGEVCSCGATRNTQPISAMDYAINKYADQMIKAAKPGQKITLEFGEFNSFPRYMMEKVAARMNDNITFVFKFKQNKKMQTVTIEPGTAIDLQYDWYGPDKMKELYGAE